MKTYSWIFEEHQPETSTIVGFIHNAIQNFAKNPIQSIVREGIQNSSDALDDTKTQVKVVVKTGILAKNEVLHLRDIEDHLRSCKSRDNNTAENSEIQRHINYITKDQMFYPYIEISDYNTKGMDPKSFLYFTQGDFKSNKDDPGSQGSKGVGKAAYYACSSLRTMIISTKTDEGLQFRGASRLATHRDPNNPERFLKNQGYFGHTDFVDINDVPLRFRRYEKGTSIFVIGAWHTGKGFKDAVITEVLRNYWFAIAANQLVVEVEGETVNNECLESLMMHYFRDYRDYRTGDKQNPRPYYETYKKGMIYTRKIAHIGECKLWLHKNASFNLGAVARFRKTKMLIYKENNIDPGFAGIFLCEDSEGNRFLKDIENEAHDEWSPKLNPDKEKEARTTLKEINEFITDSYYKYAGVDDSDSFGLDSLNEIFGFTEQKEGEKKDDPAKPNPKPESEEDSDSREKIILNPVFISKQKEGRYYYDLSFTSPRSIRDQKIKFSIATESSRDSVKIQRVKNLEFSEDIVTMDIRKGENKIVDIEFETPYLVAPFVTSLK